MKFIGNTSSIDLIIDGFETSESIQYIKKIISGNLCELIEEDLKAEEKESGKKLCEKLLNGAFKSGIGNALSEFIKNIKNREKRL